MTNLAHLLKHARQEAGMSQKELAERTGLSLPTIRAMEQGVNAGLVTSIIQIANACGFEVTLKPKEKAR